MRGQNKTYIVAATSSITVDNGADAPVQAPEIILASNDRIDLTSNSVISAVGTVTGASTGDLNFVTNFDFLPTSNNQRLWNSDRRSRFRGASLKWRGGKI